MPALQLVSVFDCCHSGTMLDLPYEFQASDAECRRGSSMVGKSSGSIKSAAIREVVSLGLLCVATALVKIKLGGYGH